MPFLGWTILVLSIALNTENAWIMGHVCVTLNGTVISVTFLFVQITALQMESVMLTLQGVCVHLDMEVNVELS